MKIYTYVFSIAVMLSALAGLSCGVVIVDDFNRPNDPNLNNGWAETVWYGDFDEITEAPESELAPILHIDPQLKNGQGEFVRTGGVDIRVAAAVTRAVAPDIRDVKLDMTMGNPNTAHNTGFMRFGLSLIDDANNKISVQLSHLAGDPNAPNQQIVYIVYNGEDQLITGIPDYREWNTYRIVINEEGGILIYINDELQMQTIAGVFGTTAAVEIGATRWWRWHQFLFDNFLAVGDIETCEDVRNLGKTLEMDFDQDCVVGISELAYMIDDWLKCNVPYQTGCQW